MSDDSESVAWPGFVDILSAVIIMFVFFVMITSIIVYMLAQDFKKKVISTMEEARYEEVINGMNDIKELLDPKNLVSSTDIEADEADIEEMIEQTVELLRRLKETDLQRVREFIAGQEQLDAQQAQGMEAQLKALKQENKLLTNKVKELSKDLQLNVGIRQQGNQKFSYDQAASRIDIIFNDSAAMLEESIGKQLSEIVSQQRAGASYNIQVNGSASNMSFTKMKETSFTRAMNVRNILLQQGVNPDNIALNIIKDTSGKGEGYGTVAVSIR